MNKKNEYSTTVYCGTVNGKAIRKHIRASSQRELNRKANAIKQSVAEGKDVYSCALFGVWADKWLNECKKPAGISTGTITQYKSAIKHINKVFEFTELKNIKLSDFQCFINELAAYNPNTNKPMAKATLENIIKTAAAVCNYARSNDIAGVPDFFKQVSISKMAPRKERRALTEEEQEWIINTPHRCQPAAMILLFSGLRRGELIPLKWSDVDLKRSVISVNKAVEFKSNQAILKNSGKSAAALRIVPIPPILVQYLKEYKKSSDSELLISNTKGNMHSKTSFRKMWDSYIKDLNIKYGYSNVNASKFNPEGLPLRIEPFTPHYLRHTYATILFLQNISVAAAKQYMGHSDIQTTFNIYTDLKNNSRLLLSETYKKKLQQEYKIFEI